MDQTLLNFTEALASDAPTPGGGGAAAVMGALGAALGAMAARLSAGRKSCAENADELTRTVERCEALRLRFLNEIEADAAAFLPLAAAYKIPKETPGRQETLRRASLDACSAAMEMLRLCAATAALLARLKDCASPLLLSDVGCSAAACRAALLSASYNVFVNTKPYADDGEAQGLSAAAKALLQEALPKLEDVELQVLLALQEEEA